MAKKDLAKLLNELEEFYDRREIDWYARQCSNNQFKLYPAIHFLRKFTIEDYNLVDGKIQSKIQYYFSLYCYKQDNPGSRLFDKPKS